MYECVMCNAHCACCHQWPNVAGIIENIIFLLELTIVEEGLAKDCNVQNLIHLQVLASILLCIQYSYLKIKFVNK